MIDLHIHSEFSIDAADSPEAIIERAATAGLCAVSITDHENINSLPRARAKATELGLDYINGVEIGVAEFAVGDAVIPTHILGYGFEQPAPNITKLCARIRANGSLNANSFIAGLRILGIPVTKSDIEAVLPNRFSTYAIRRFLRERGIVNGKPEAMALQHEALAAAERHTGPRLPAPHTIPEVLAALKADGAVSLMAHPFWTTKPERGGQSEETVWRHILMLLDLGVDGLEAYNTCNDAGYGDILLEFCKTHSLPASAGSDSHGMGKVGQRLYDSALLHSLLRFQASAPPWK